MVSLVPVVTVMCAAVMVMVRVVHPSAPDRVDLLLVKVVATRLGVTGLRMTMLGVTGTHAGDIFECSIRR